MPAKRLQIMDRLFRAYPPPYAPPGEPLPMNRQFLKFFLAKMLPLVAIFSAPVTSILLQLLVPDMTTTTTLIIALGLTIVALGTILVAVMTGVLSDQVMHSLFLLGVWARPVFENLPTEWKKSPWEMLGILVALFTVCGLVVSQIHRYFGFMDTSVDWKRSLQLSWVMLQIVCCCF
ncbi:hypothetical protein C8J56DRAFT_930795 [Mycena floridula]|nr:hypothetical protein C8J56DRAFT_930795 [Mycena floridula]